MKLETVGKNNFKFKQCKEKFHELAASFFPLVQEECRKGMAKVQSSEIEI